MVHEVSFWQLAALFPLSVLIKAWFCTLRFQGSKETFEALAYDPRPPIQLLWHNRIFLAAGVRKRYGSKRWKCSAMISASKDGAWLAALYRLLGINPIRGSSSWRGGKVLMDAIKGMENGCDLAMTPDGPRGPKYSVKEGAVNIASKSGCPIILASATFHKAKRFKSWDEFYLPYPFSKITLRAVSYDNLDAFLKAKKIEEKDASDAIRKELLELNKA